MKLEIQGSTGSATVLGHVRYGRGPVNVLVLHDWLGDHTNYDELMPLLDGSAFTYVFADLRGYGLSIDLSPTCNVDEIASDCLRLADTLAWRRFHVLGHSMTGMITQRLAAVAPGRIASAIAVCPVSAAGNRLSTEALAFFVDTTHNDNALLRLFQYVTGLGAVWAKRKVRQNRMTVAPGCRMRYLDMLVNADFVDEIQGLATPFLVLVGDKDPGLEASTMERTFLAWHPNATLHVIANSGHYPMQECAPYFAKVIEDFLNRHAD